MDPVGAPTDRETGPELAGRTALASSPIVRVDPARVPTVLVIARVCGPIAPVTGRDAPATVPVQGRIGPATDREPDLTALARAPIARKVGPTGRRAAPIGRRRDLHKDARRKRDHLRVVRPRHVPRRHVPRRRDRHKAGLRRRGHKPDHHRPVRIVLSRRVLRLARTARPAIPVGEEEDAETGADVRIVRPSI